MAISVHSLSSTVLASLLCLGLAACTEKGFDPDATQTLERNSGASVVVYDFGDLTLHDYNDAPVNGVGNNTYIIETDNNTRT